jgi:hypothetical protein
VKDWTAVDEHAIVASEAPTRESSEPVPGTQVRELGTVTMAPRPETRFRKSVANSEQRLAE